MLGSENLTLTCHSKTYGSEVEGRKKEEKKSEIKEGREGERTERRKLLLCSGFLL
jgi:hypothetical protein